MPPRPRPPISHIVEQHAEEAAFLWRCATPRSMRRTTSATTWPGSTSGSRRTWTGCASRARRAGEIALAPAGAAGREGRAVRGRRHAGRDRRSRPGGALRGLCGTVPREPARARRRYGLGGGGAPGNLVRAWLDSDRPLERYLAVAACSVHRVDPHSRLAGWSRTRRRGPGTSAQAGGRAGPRRLPDQLARRRC